MSSPNQGARAEEKHLSTSPNTLFRDIGDYVIGVSSYLPSSIKKSILPTTPTSNDEGKDKINSSFFEIVHLPQKGPRLCLFLTYQNGFQVWDVHDNQNVHEILSKREDLAIKSIKFLKSPQDTSKDRFVGRRPLLAVTSLQDLARFPTNIVKLFSGPKGDYINNLRFRSEVFSVQSTLSVFAVSLRDHIYGFDSQTMEKLFSLPCFPALNSSSVHFTLGSQWIAYAGNRPLPRKSKTTEDTPENSRRKSKDSTTAWSVAKGAAQGLASGLYYLGDVGMQQVSSYLYDMSIEPDEPTPSDIQNSQNIGTVLVYDFVNKFYLAHFKAHTQSISYMAFDPSGALLLTSADGHNFHIYQINPIPGSTHVTPQHLYNLKRGVTNASIRSVSFSTDSKWVSVSSTRGTTHIFAINPIGGPVSKRTHITRTEKRPSSLYEQSDPLLPYITPTLQIPVCCRIKNNSLNNEEFFPVSSYFLGKPPSLPILYVLGPVGLMTRYEIVVSPDQSDTFTIVGEPISEHDVCRRGRWPEYSDKFETPNVENNRNEMNGQSWLSHVEINTYSPHIKPLWTNGFFSFKIYEKDNSGSVQYPSSISTQEILAAKTTPIEDVFDDRYSSPETSVAFHDDDHQERLQAALTNAEEYSQDSKEPAKSHLHHHHHGEGDNESLISQPFSSLVDTGDYE